MSLKEFTVAELQAEIDEREILSIDKPEAVDAPDFRPVICLCGAQIDMLANQNKSPKDIDGYIYEAAMEAVFGKDVFEWINQFG